MKKVLYFDLERGSKTLGSEEDIESLFGYPVLAPTTFDGFQKAISSMYTTKRIDRIKTVGSVKVPEVIEQAIPKEGVEIDVLVLDTFSELSKKYQRSICGKDGRLQMQDWGKLKNKLDQTLDYITKIPGIVILNVHSKITTLGDGSTKVLPYIDGSTKEDISKWFDFVFYTKTITGTNRKIQYVWQTSHTEMYDHAKDRTNSLPPLMAQDYQLVLDAVEKKGFDGAKILIIGSPGTGKTMSLKTLVPKVKEKQTTKAA